MAKILCGYPCRSGTFFSSSINLLQIYDLWADDSSKEKTKSELARMRMHFPAPKISLPGHAESYNPPAEYLCDEEELKKWEVSSL